MTHLQEIAFGREERELVITLSSDEMTAMKDELFQKIVELDRIADELHEIKQEYKERMGPIRETVAKLKRELRNGHRLETRLVYLVQNFDTGNMDYTTEDGEVVFSRRLLPNEREGNIFSISKGAQA